MGYGARALQALNSFYAGELSNLDELPEEDPAESFAAASRFEKVRRHIFRCCSCTC